MKLSEAATQEGQLLCKSIFHRFSVNLGELASSSRLHNLQTFTVFFIWFVLPSAHLISWESQIRKSDTFAIFMLSPIVPGIAAARAHDLCFIAPAQHLDSKILNL